MVFKHIKYENKGMIGAFHVGNAELTGNEILKEMLRFIHERTNLRYRTERIPLTRMDEADREHTRILSGIKGRDKKMALKILNDHIKKMKYNLYQIIKSEE